jgi:hypothetical protein
MAVAVFGVIDMCCGPGFPSFSPLSDRRIAWMGDRISDSQRKREAVHDSPSCWFTIALLSPLKEKQELVQCAQATVRSSQVITSRYL